MSGRVAAVVAAALTVAPVARAEQPSADRHHYTISARVRPFLLFWITRRSVGDAIVTRHRTTGEARYTLLIGSDPDRAPLHINRWGYIEEETHGRDTRLLGLMTESEEDSLEQAQAGIRMQAAGRHRFKIIQGIADGEFARSRVRVIAAPDDYSIRQLPLVLGLAQRESADGVSRVIRLPAGARPGFLSALADAIHSGSQPIAYVHYGRVYELRRTRAQPVVDVRVGETSYGPGIAADFTATSAYDGEQTRFSITYGTHGAFAEVPLRVTYQPRWWMQLELTIDDEAGAPALSDHGVER